MDFHEHMLDVGLGDGVGGIGVGGIVAEVEVVFGGGV